MEGNCVSKSPMLYWEGNEPKDRDMRLKIPLG